MAFAKCMPFSLLLLLFPLFLLLWCQWWMMNVLLAHLGIKTIVWCDVWSLMSIIIFFSSPIFSSFWPTSVLFEIEWNWRCCEIETWLECGNLLYDKFIYSQFFVVLLRDSQFWTQNYSILREIDWTGLFFDTRMYLVAIDFHLCAKSQFNHSIPKLNE